MSGPNAIRDWVQAPPDVDAWECERGHRRQVPLALSLVHKGEACRYPSGVRTACSAWAALKKARAGTAPF